MTASPDRVLDWLKATSACGPIVLMIGLALKSRNLKDLSVLGLHIRVRGIQKDSIAYAWILTGLAVCGWAAFSDIESGRGMNWFMLAAGVMLIGLRVIAPRLLKNGDHEMNSWIFAIKIHKGHRPWPSGLALSCGIVLGLFGAVPFIGDMITACWLRSSSLARAETLRQNEQNKYAERIVHMDRGPITQKLFFDGIVKGTQMRVLVVGKAGIGKSTFLKFLGSEVGRAIGEGRTAREFSGVVYFEASGLAKSKSISEFWNNNPEVWGRGYAPRDGLPCRRMEPADF